MFFFSCHNFGMMCVLKTTRKQTRFETPKFIKRCNCIEMKGSKSYGLNVSQTRIIKLQLVAN